MRELTELLNTMAYLRDPANGCRWDCRQSFASIAPYTLEEAYEVLDAIERNDYVALQDELGDLLLQVIFYAQIASEDRLFNFNDVVSSIRKKLNQRHPHLRQERTHEADRAGKRHWEYNKQQQRQTRESVGSLDGLTTNLPALHFAQKLQLRAAYFGFDWENATAVLKKIDEEVAEIKQAIIAAKTHNDNDCVQEEIGDLLFTVVNLARHFSLNAEFALRSASRKFMRRFEKMEELLAQNQRSIEDATMREMQVAWEQAKKDI